MCSEDAQREVNRFVGVMEKKGRFLALFDPVLLYELSSARARLRYHVLWDLLAGSEAAGKSEETDTSETNAFSMNIHMGSQRHKGSLHTTIVRCASCLLHN